MITLVVSAAPPRLRGHLTRWLSEVMPGVYVGKVTPRVREELWTLVKSELAGGRAALTYPTRNNEQGYEILLHNSNWSVEDFEGLQLIRRPLTSQRKKVLGSWARDSQSRSAARNRW